VPELLDFLRSPTVPEKEKVRLTDVVCEKVRIGPVVSNLLNVLIRRHRIGLLRHIAGEFDRIAADYEGVWTASVETARPLAEDDVETLRRRLADAVGTEVRMETRVREELLGGVRVRMHDTLIDGSLRSRLDQLESQLER
jgi:F-type H+-transporting ATPase subunit delta